MAILVDDHLARFWVLFPVDELVEKAGGFAGVFREHKYDIVRIIQGEGHVCGMTGNGVNNALALKADVGIAVSDARGATDIALTRARLRGTRAESACAICDETEAC
uniref:Uncharacterized protein n=1 Tax=Oryza punctata TaxID=4537 RepID=A0A0E0M9U7_ORYPU